MKKYILLTIKLLFVVIVTSCQKDEDITTTSEPQLSVSTIEISEVTDSSILTGGIITNLSNDPVIEKGVCWHSSIIEPTTDEFKLNEGLGNGAYSSLVDELSPGTTYYLRAYAKNATETAYGKVHTFTTQELVENSKIVYPETSFNGLNILSDAVTTIKSSSSPDYEWYGLHAVLPKTGHLKIILKKGKWVREISSEINWYISDYEDYDAGTKTQTFSSVDSDRTCDLRMGFEKGTITIEYYENGSDVPTKTKQLIVE